MIKAFFVHSRKFSTSDDIKSFRKDMVDKAEFLLGSVAEINPLEDEVADFDTYVKTKLAQDVQLMVESDMVLYPSDNINEVHADTFKTLLDIAHDMDKPILNLNMFKAPKDTKEEGK